MSRYISTILLYLFLFLNPLIYTHTSEFPKFIFITVFGEILIITYLLSNQVFKKDRLTLIASVFMLILFISDLAGIDPRTSLIGSPIRHQGFILWFSCFLIFIVSRHKFEKIQTLNFTNTIIFSSFVLSLISAANFFLLQAHLVNIPNFGGRIVATMGNPNFLGGYMAMTLPFLLWSKIRNRFKLPLFFLDFFVIVITFSRSAIVAVLLIVIIYLYEKYKKKVIYFILILFAVAGLIFSSNDYLSKQIKRFSPWDSRIIIWSQALQAISKKPVLGYGQENFELVFPKNLGMTVDSAHNIFLEITLSTGILGLLVFLDLLKNKFAQKNKMVNLSILVFLVVASFNPLSVAEIALFWILLSLDVKISDS